MRFDLLPLKLTKSLLLLLIPIQLISQSIEQRGPYLATGIRIGDVSQTEAVIWTRLTLNKKRISDGPQPIALYTDPETGKKHTRKTRRDKNGMIYFPQGYDINSIEGAVPGRKGEVRVQFSPTGSNVWQTTPWEAVDPKANFSKKFILNGLESGTQA